MADAILSIHKAFAGSIEIMSASAPGGTYRLSRDTFAPPIPEYNHGLFRNGVPYKPMQWEFQVNIHGATAPEAYEAYRALVDLLETVPEWRAGAIDGYPAYIMYRPKNSANTDPLFTNIRELVDISTPRSFLDAGDTFVIKDIRVRLITLPGYYDPNPESGSGSYSFGAVNSTALATFHPTVSPLSVDITLTNPQASITSDPAPKVTTFLAAVGDLGAAQCVQVGGFGSNGYTSIVDTASLWAPYNVLRWTPPGASTWYAIPGTNTTLFDTALQKQDSFLVYVLCRSNNNVEYKIRTRFSTDGTTVKYGREVAIPYNSGRVQLLYLGTIDFGKLITLGSSFFNFELQAPSASGTVDFLTMFVIRDRPTSTVVTLDMIPLETLTSRYFRISHRLLGEEALLRPEVAIYSGAARMRNPRYEGNAYPLAWGEFVDNAVIFPHSTAWRLPNSTNTGPASYSITLERYNMYRSPV